jgi:hypothetical protein
MRLSLKYVTAFIVGLGNLEQAANVERPSLSKLEGKTLSE